MITLTMIILLVKWINHKGINHKPTTEVMSAYEPYDDDFMCILTSHGDTVAITGETVLKVSRLSHFNA